MTFMQHMLYFMWPYSVASEPKGLHIFNGTSEHTLAMLAWDLPDNPYDLQYPLVHGEEGQR